VIEIEGVIGDEELAALALAADPEPVVADDARPLSEVLGADAPTLLPEWYMPAPMGGQRVLGGWRRRVIFLVIVSFLVITGFGLCNTYDQLHIG
jgi:hypothetical protein